MGFVRLATVVLVAVFVRVASGQNATTPALNTTAAVVISNSTETRTKSTEPLVNSTRVDIGKKVDNNRETYPGSPGSWRGSTPGPTLTKHTEPPVNSTGIISNTQVDSDKENDAEKYPGSPGTWRGSPPGPALTKNHTEPLVNSTGIINNTRVDSDKENDTEKYPGSPGTWRGSPPGPALTKNHTEPLVNSTGIVNNTRVDSDKENDTEKYPGSPGTWRGSPPGPALTKNHTEPLVNSTGIVNNTRVDSDKENDTEILSGSDHEPTFAPSCKPANPCPTVIKIDWWEIPPYIYKPKDSHTVEGIFPQVLSELVKQCCGACVNLSYNEQPSNDSEVVKKNIGNNNTVISLPIYGDMKEIRFQDYPFYPLVESPGVVFVIKKEDSSAAAKAVMEAVFQGWPVLLLTLIMAALSGIIVWALDTYWNPEEFPRSFFRGTWEGFWWAFVSMTTVGYGDRAPRSVLARTFAFVWVLIGLVIISIFTATVTTSLTAISLSNDIKLYGSDVVALKNTEEQRLGVRSNAKVTEKNSVRELKDAVLSDTPKVQGALLDSYVAGYWAKNKVDPVLKHKDLRVGTVVDHQFAYGFVIADELKNQKGFEQCVRKHLNSMETVITSIIQSKAETMEEPGESAAVEKTSNLFDANSPIFQQAIFTCLGLVAVLTICGLIWEFAYWRPRQPKEAKTEVERIVTPETSYENLIAQQCAEIEEAMMNEVQRFYVAWNKKLEELKRRNGQMSPNDVNVMGMSGGDIRSM